MSIEADIYNALQGFGPVFPDVAPAGTARPYLTFQQVGGVALNFLGAVPPSKKNGRFQINCWADTRLSVATLSRQVEDAMVTTLKAYVLGAPLAIFEEETQLYGTMQDFSVYFNS